ncbi:glycoside hydrolase family protein [Roseateles cavernae]|uniref:glycoside hydrolase family protein n=1 Tax=Roseateles cavernae TaxID=3153578 RepID=UPI0032E44042
MSKARISVWLLTLSAAGFASWQAHEGWTASPVIPTQGDVPTVGHGSTRYEDGTPVRMTDPPITRKRAEELARNLNSEEEMRFSASIPHVDLHQAEFDVYMDFTGNFGIGNWRKSSMRKHLLAGEYRQACDALLQWRKQAGRDCSLSANWGPQGCKGVWTRQRTRHEKCLAAQ